MGADHTVHDPDPARPLLSLAVAKILRATLPTALAMGADRAVHVLHDPDPARPLLPLVVAKILRALALQESPGLLILGKQNQVFYDFEMLAGEMTGGQATDGVAGGEARSGSDPAAPGLGRGGGVLLAEGHGELRRPAGT
ncbi:hypothetical protein D1007_09872 [Hordeum vulgare]|nr:hypothetical protein D1007_09872 [Hordeum vulgare]